MSLPDSAKLLRLVWNPAHFAGDKLKTSAFPSQDLIGSKSDDGQRRYLSVDDHALLSKPSVDWRIGWFQRDGLDQKHGRLEARFVSFPLATLSSIVHENVGLAFRVDREPIPEGGDGEGSPENPAHCGLKSLGAEYFESLSKGEQRRQAEMIRTQLIQSCDAIFSYRELFAPDGA